MEITSLLTFLEGMGIDNPCKYLTCRDFLRRVPGRTRTVMIIFSDSAKLL